MLTTDCSHFCDSDSHDGCDVSWKACKEESAHVLSLACFGDKMFPRYVSWCICHLGTILASGSYPTFLCPPAQLRCQLFVSVCCQCRPFKVTWGLCSHDWEMRMWLLSVILWARRRWWESRLSLLCSTSIYGRMQGALILLQRQKYLLPPLQSGSWCWCYRCPCIMCKGAMPLNRRLYLLTLKSIWNTEVENRSSLEHIESYSKPFLKLKRTYNTNQNWGRGGLP